MPKPLTTAAMTLVSNHEGTVALAVNAKAGPGASITEWSVDWGDGEEETNTVPLPATARHAYVGRCAPLIIFTVRDSKSKVVSTGMNLLVAAAPEPPIPPEPGTLDAKIPAADSGVLFGERAWQYQAVAAPVVRK
jgi:hypothetical protein